MAHCGGRGCLTPYRQGDDRKEARLGRNIAPLRLYSLCSSHTANLEQGPTPGALGGVRPCGAIARRRVCEGVSGMPTLRAKLSWRVDAAVLAGHFTGRVAAVCAG